MSLGKSLVKNWLTLIGGVVALGALFIFILLFVVDLLFGHTSPYFDLMAYFVIPAFLMGGLGLIVLGFLVNYWLENRVGGKVTCWCSWLKMKSPNPIVDFSKSSTWCIILCIVAILAIGGSVAMIAAYKVFHWSEADEFCGELCHVPMQPENVSYKDSTHAEIHCVECHVGPGVEAYATAKLNGVRQLAQAVTKTYATPIPVPVSAMYAKHLDGKTKIEHTCLSCHSDKTNHGVKERTFVHYLKNEEDIKSTVRMTLKVGGGENAQAGDIHWHIAPGNKVEFVTKENKREGEISWLKVTTAAGATNVYAREGFKFEPEKQKVFTMTCLECHNRTAHKYLSPVTMVDLAIETGKINLELGDSVKAIVVDLLAEKYETEEAAMEAIKTGLTDAYDGSELLPAAIQTVQGLYKQNIFPAMKAQWSAYPNYLGHKESLGCARCHNSKLENSDSGEAVRTDCKLCHTIIAQSKDEEWDESDVKGLVFQHPDGSDKDDIANCSRCHDGTY